MICIFINDSEVKFTDLIFNREKHVETRSRPTLDRYCDQLVGVIRTGCGENALIGVIELSNIGLVWDNEDEFRNSYWLHKVPAGSKYDIKPGHKKYGYKIKEVYRFDKPDTVAPRYIKKRFGRVACEI